MLRVWASTARNPKIVFGRLLTGLEGGDVHSLQLKCKVCPGGFDYWPSGLKDENLSQRSWFVTGGLTLTVTAGMGAGEKEGGKADARGSRPRSE